MTKMVKKVKVIKTVEISQIDQDGEDQEPNDQPATSSIYLARQGLVQRWLLHAPTFPLSKISGNKSSTLEVSGVSHPSFKVKT